MEVFGVVDEGAGGLVGVSSVEGRLREEEDAIDDRGGNWDVPTGGEVGTRLLIPSGEVFNSGKNPFASAPS